MAPKFLRHNIENIIINKLGENQEEKKSIAMILDGKMFESKLRGLLSPEGNSKDVHREKIDLIDEGEQKIITNMRKHVNKYIQLYNEKDVLNKNGEIKWKFIEWFWCYNRKILRDYFLLTRKLDLHEVYRKDTGKNYIYRGDITLSYIKWLYRFEKQDLMNFMKKTCPIF